MFDWLTKIGDCLRFQNTWVWINFSFLMSKDETLQYVFAAKALSIQTYKLYDKEGWMEFTELFRGKNEQDFLQELLASKEESPFRESGYRPYKLVSAYIWIHK